MVCSFIHLLKEFIVGCFWKRECFWVSGRWVCGCGFWCVCLWCVVCTVLVLYRRLLCSLWLDWMELETLNGMV